MACTEKAAARFFEQLLVAASVGRSTISWAQRLCFQGLDGCWRSDITVMAHSLIMVRDAPAVVADSASTRKL